MKYTLEDCGCYVDSARGMYAVDRIVEFANEHGAEIKHDDNCDGCKDVESSFPSEFGKCLYSNSYEDEADEFMNDNFPVDCAYWGRNENFDWGLWKIEED